MSENAIGRLYKIIRLMCMSFMSEQPILFDEDEIVEIDKLYDKSLKEEERTEWPPIIGMIGRKSRKVVLHHTHHMIYSNSYYHTFHKIIL
jgi:hypothetical protein